MWGGCESEVDGCSAEVEGVDDVFFCHALLG